MELNCDEIERMGCKLSLLLSCLDVIDLGFQYENYNSYVIDIFAGQDGFSNVEDFSIATDVLMPIIGDGNTFYNEDMEDYLESLGLDIPHEEQDQRFIIGHTFIFRNQIIDKFINCEIPYQEILWQYGCELESIMTYEYSDATGVQILFESGGLMVVIPEPYIDVHPFVNSTIGLMRTLKELTQNYIKEKTEEEVA